MTDEEARKSNMIAYSAEERIIHTYTFLDQMRMTELKEEYILHVSRLGKKQDDKNKPIRVTLDTLAAKNSIFSNTAKLRDADEKYKQLGLEVVFIIFVLSPPIYQSM